MAQPANWHSQLASHSQSVPPVDCIVFCIVVFQLDLSENRFTTNMAGIVIRSLRSDTAL